VVSYVNTDRVREEYIKVEEMILFGRYPYLNTQSANSANTALEEAIQLLNIDSIRHKYLNGISDGEWQKANIARALVQDTPVIIMDEPSAFLDYPAKVQLFKDLQTIAQNKNKLIIVSTHDLDIANRYGSAFWQIENGVLSTSRLPFAIEL
jgi:iron complex transport system ATP-binding protein